jgi:adenylate kinase family enzyme
VQVLAWNYVEEADVNANGGAMVSFGFETSMTATAAMAGGMFVIDAASLEITARVTSAFSDENGAPFPVLVFTPVPVAQVAPPVATLEALSAAAQEMALLNEGATHDAAGGSDAETKQNLLEGVVIPQLQRGKECDMEALGRAIGAMQNLGSKRVEVVKRPEGAAICAFLDAAHRVDGALIAGMSSIGPSVAVVCRFGNAVEEALKAAAEACGMQLSYATAVNTDGLHARSVAAPRLVVVAGKPFSGKTWICKELVAGGALSARRVAHFAASSVLRAFASDEATAKTPEAAVVRSTLEQGRVEDPSGLFSKILVSELLGQEAARHMAVDDQRIATGGQDDAALVLLDGFPRSATQLHCVVEQYGLTISAVVVVCATDDVRCGRERDGPRRGRAASEPALAEREQYDETQAIVAAAQEMGIAVEVLENSNGDEALLAVQSFVALQL